MTRRAFGQDQESNIVDTLKTNGGALLSLFATLDDRVVGHILCSPVSVSGKGRRAALGPLAALPEHERKENGTRLIEVGNRKIKDAGYPFIIVVCYAAYYPRFRFGPASKYKIKCEWLGEYPVGDLDIDFALCTYVRVSKGNLK